jgi:SPP1 gp7 family putative phage head morphogenesis protein
VAEPRLVPLTDEEALAALRRRTSNLAPSFSWLDISAAEHRAEFTVAKSAGFDILGDVADALDRVIAEGRTFQQFKADLRPHLEAKGWWGHKEVVDPADGQAKMATLGTPRRLKTIFDCNVRVSHAAGQWERIQRVKEQRPYLMYDPVHDRRTRPQHLAWGNVVLPVDDPWWDTHYPPNGWRCRCRVRQLGPRDLDREGLVVTRPLPDRMVTFTNARTGEMTRVPKGIDPGWATNVGKTGHAQAERAMVVKLDQAPPAMTHAAIRGLVDSEAFAQFLLAPAKGTFPVLRLPDAAAEAIGAKERVAVLSSDTLAKQRGETARSAGHPELGVDDYRRLPDMGESPDLVIKTSDQAVVVIKRDGKHYLAAVKATRDGRELYVTSLRLTNKEDVDRLVRHHGILMGRWEG